MVPLLDASLAHPCPEAMASPLSPDVSCCPPSASERWADPLTGKVRHGQMAAEAQEHAEEVVEASEQREDLTMEEVRVVHKPKPFPT